ncbi:MAG: hypothetical protein ABW026_15500 [Microvirga sp.]
MKLLAVTFTAVALLSASAASSQTIQLGPSGPSVDFRSPEQRQREDMRDRQRDRAVRGYDRESTGSVGRRDCREVVVREQDEFGNSETHREMRCRR